MRIVDFIRAKMDEIIETWMNFALSIPALKYLSLEQQKYHVREVLHAIIKDLDRPQSKKEQFNKSLGDQTQKEAGQTGLNFNSGEHGVMRFTQGMSTHEVLSEFRALRAAVLRLWSRNSDTHLTSVIQDLTRFNEAIDQSLSQSIITYTAEQNKKIQLLDQILSTIPEHAFVVDPNGRLLYANRALAEYVAKQPDQLLGKTLVELGLQSAQQFEKEIDLVIATKVPVQTEISTGPETGEKRIYEYVLNPVFNEVKEVQAITGTARDITEKKLFDNAIWKKANFDSLTKLPNRHLFQDRLEHEVQHAKRTNTSVALLFIDLDRFKEVNDALGHGTGDQLLQEVAHRICASTRAEDTVARIGGDEFTVILTKIEHAQDAQHIAQKIVERLAEPFMLNNKEVQISASIGISLHPRDAVTPEDMIRSADQAMYVAKNTGGSRTRFFSEEMQQKTAERIRLIAELRHGLTAHEFVVYFQPIFNMKTGQIEKAEALVRWNHPRLGMLLPISFITVAEEAGLIADIDNLVLIEATQRSLQWRGSSTFQISVNKSALTFLESTHAAWQMGLPDEIAPNSLAIEITESVLLQSSPQILHRIASLRKRGVQIALDDFGTGYSALSYLTHFEVDYLKIDRVFIQDLIANPTHHAVASAIIVLAHELGMAVIAEGVENLDQKEWLISKDCDYAQGFLYSEALPAAAFAELLQQRSVMH